MLSTVDLVRSNISPAKRPTNVSHSVVCSTDADRPFARHVIRQGGKEANKYKHVQACYFR